jgi:membrane carboxypeptidase/penicillin-binding protein
MSQKGSKSQKRAIITTFAALFLLLIVLVGAGFSYLFIFKDLPSPYSLKDYKVIPLSTHIYDRNGKLLYEVYKDENRTPVKLSDLLQYHQ